MTVEKLIALLSECEMDATVRAYNIADLSVEDVVEVEPDEDDVLIKF